MGELERMGGEWETELVSLVSDRSDEDQTTSLSSNSKVLGLGLGLESGCLIKPMKRKLLLLLWWW